MTKRHHKNTWTIFITQPSTHPSPDFYISLAQRAEKAKLHGLIVLDELLEPSVYFTAIGQNTKTIGLTVGYTTEGEHPYLQARKFSTLDELNGGRLGWANTPDLRYSEEYLHVYTELVLSSWRDDALLKNKETGIWIDTDLLRQIDFEGDTYQVPGPGLSKPTPQRLPLLVSLDTSTDSARRHAAKYAEVISIAGDEHQVKRVVNDLKDLIVEYGRDVSSVKFLAQVFVVVEETADEAHQNILHGPPPPLSYRTIRGTKNQVADILQSWIENTGIQGFNFHASNIDNWSVTLVDELQSRGVLQSEYSTVGGTLRENVFELRDSAFLAADHPLFHYRWFRGQSQKEFEVRLASAKEKVLATTTGYH